MSVTSPSPLLRKILLFDAATCTGMGVVLVLGAGVIAPLTGIPTTLLFYAGVALFPIAAFMAVVAGRAGRWPAGVWLVVLGNAGWVAGSLWLMVGGVIAPTGLGHAFIAIQALAVAGLAAVEYVALRRAATAAPA